MKFDTETLPDDSATLKEIVLDLQADTARQQASYEQQISVMLEQINLLRTQIYGRKSEKHLSAGSAEPIPLFDIPEDAAPDEDKEAKEKSTSVSGYTRKKGGRKPLPKDLPRKEIIHDIDEADKICACGCTMTKIGEETSEQLDVIPAQVQVLRHVRPKYACRQCEGLEDEGPSVKIAPPPPQIIPKSMASPGLLAALLICKFCDHLPFYRQEKIFQRLGVELSRTLMCRWAMQVAEACVPLINLLVDELLAYDYMHIDETTVQVLQEPGRDPTTKSYMWIFKRGDPQRQILLYQYHSTRSGAVVRDMLDEYEGFVQTDGYAGYNFLDNRDGIRHIGCLAHARRKFADIIKAQGKNAKPGAANQGLAFFKKLYKIEKECRQQALSPDEIYQRRQLEAKPIMDNLQQWLLKKQRLVPPKSSLGLAVAYCLSQWHRLVGYLDDGRLAPDNNAAENAIRPFVLGRKNWMFSGTPEGAQASASLYSLIETAKANGCEPYKYLRNLFERLPLAKKLEDYDALLPWNINLREMQGKV